MSLRIGVDTGGTFTDVVAYDDETGAIHVRKVSSTRDDPGRAIITGVLEILEQIGGRTAEEVGYFAHGTTVGTNALLTYRGVPTAVITTRGFRDLLELGRGRRPRLYDLQADKPEALARRSARFEVTERVRHDGRIETPLDEHDVRKAAAAISARGIRSVAVCLLYSFLRPEHERRIREILHEELGRDVFVTLSCEVLPEFREFERLSTTVVNAYVGPVVADYLAALRKRLADIRLGVVPHVTQSNGGIIPFEAAEQFPVRMVLSGPSTGVVGAAGIAATAGHPDIITFDMGGTSSDVSLVQNGRPKVTKGMELDGRPIRSPMLDIHTVGAGGGSIAWIDAGNHLKVGPASAGSDPGPACYGKGSEATVTDANVVLRTLNPEYLLDGQMRIDSSASEQAVTALADRLGLDVQAAAQGIIRVVVANMARAIRVISVQRGYDPRDYTLVPFGGAGPLHASWLARELGIATILVPPTPGAQSALGLLMTDVRADFTRTAIRRFDAAHVADIRQVLVELTDQATEWFADEDIPQERRHLGYAIEMRYVGQNYELPVTLAAGDLTEESLPEVLARFAVEHERLYGYSAPGDPVEAVTYRVQGIGDVPTAELAAKTTDGSPVDIALVGRRELRVAEVGGSAVVPVYHRSKLQPGHRIDGPALIEQMDTTTVVLPGDQVVVDEHLNLIVRVTDGLVASSRNGAEA
ncbi:hydantoinase/oxoprolinase family protein [Dactylosporangium sp. CA-139114]|uniref:hydantoinase/oxoprolinase family protein n=1 Tax=Dactylosporangium sp. CA-139114 TaxID=3239931 RepID=UPI003D97B2C2